MDKNGSKKKVSGKSPKKKISKPKAKDAPKKKIDKKIDKKSEKNKNKNENSEKNTKLVKEIDDSLNNLGIFTMPEKIVVIGDIHADYLALTETLEKAGLINSDLDWTGRKVTVVIIGDLVDGKSRIGEWGNDSDIKVIKLINHLSEKAKEKESRIVVLLGNHEFMNMNGNFNYSGENSIKEMGGEEKRNFYFKNDFKKFAKKCFLATQFGNWVFCHAGIPQEISSNHNIAELNTMLDRFLNNNMDAVEVAKFTNIISGKNGILTNREFGGFQINNNRLNKTLENLKADHMVVGHTVQSKVNSTGDGKLWRVDTGMSRAFGEDNSDIKGFLLIYDYGKKTKIFR